MDHIQDELDWERKMINYGLDRFRLQEDKAKERGDYTGTKSGSRLLKNYLMQVSEYISHYCAGNSPGGRRRTKYTSVISAVDADKLALVALTSLISAVHSEVTVASAAFSVGGQIEDELRYAEFEIANKELFDQLQRDLDRRNSESYRHRHRVLNHSMRKANIEWRSWSHEMRASVGMIVLTLALDASDLVYKETVREGAKRSRIVLKANPEVHDWIKRSDEATAAVLPDRMPMLIKPDDWTGFTSGGYILPKLRQTTPLIKFRHGAAGRAQRDMVVNSDLKDVMRGVNGMQSTPWRINKRILETLQQVWEKGLTVGMPSSQPYEIPPSPVPSGMDEVPEHLLGAFNDWRNTARELHTKEKERQGLVLGVSRSMRIGNMLKYHERFYFVYQLDFRGRAYCTTSGINPQGADVGKGCLEFADGKPLGETGAYWLKVHGANKFGFDKGSYDSRVNWVEENHTLILAAAEDPLSNRDLWGNADKPYQFLAFCFEYANYVKNGEDHISHLPVALDGACNGLQHFSAMLGDPVGARSVNLSPSDVPADIYQDVADVCTQKLRAAAEGGENAADNWIKFIGAHGHDNIPRAASKRPVMTLPYGSSQQTCTSGLFSWYVGHERQFFPDNTGFRHCIYLSSLMWDSISEVVVAAREAMVWLQTISGELAKENAPLSYKTPLGFPMYQASPRQERIQICHRVGGSRMRVTITTPLEGLDVRKQRQGSSPNLVHSIDATHMLMCVNAGLDKGIDSFSIIHDDFGVHACNVQDWHGIIREQFVKLHTENNILKDLYDQITEKHDIDIPAPPEHMGFDLTEVLESPYFFG